MEGNQMKMREALQKIREKCVIYNNALAEEIDALCGNALDAPPRNCDVGTVEEQEVMFSKFCRVHGPQVATCDGCPLDSTNTAICELAWSQMPYNAQEGAVE